MVWSDEADYEAANANCKTPVEGESVEASYCRFLHSIFDAGIHLRCSRSPGSPTRAARTLAGLQLCACTTRRYRTAPTELHSDLEALREGFRQSGPGSSFPDDAGETRRAVSRRRLWCVRLLGLVGLTGPDRRRCLVVARHLSPIGTTQRKRAIDFRNRPPAAP